MGYFWMRWGDNAEYNDYDSLDNVIDHLIDHYEITEVNWRPDGGFEVPGWRRLNYVSLFVGDKDAQIIRDLTPEEKEEIDDALLDFRRKKRNEQY